MTFIFAYFSCSLVVSLAVTAAVVVVVLFAIFLFFRLPPLSFAVSFTLPFPLPLADCGGFLGVIAGNNFSDGRRSLSILFSSLSLTSLAFVFFIFRPVLLLFAFSRPPHPSSSSSSSPSSPRASSSRRCQHLRFPLQLLLRLSRAFHREFDRAPLTPPLRRWGDIFSLTPLTLKIIHHLFRWRSFSSHFLRDKREDSFTRLTTFSTTTTSSSSFSSVSLQRDSRNLSNREMYSF